MIKTFLIPVENGFAVSGRVDFGNVIALRREGEQHISASQSSSITIDLSSVKDHDDAAIFTLLLCWMRYAKLSVKQLHIQHAPLSFQRMQILFGLNFDG